MKKYFMVSLALAVLIAAGCGQADNLKSKDVNVQTGKATKTDFKPIAKNCEVVPPTNDVATTTNASGKVIDTDKGRIYTSEQAIPELWKEAKKFAADAELVGGYSGAGNAVAPNDKDYRVHYGSVRGAMWAWSATFYSPSKNEDVYLAYIDGEAGGSIPQTVDEQTAKYFKDNIESLKMYVDYSDMISSCQVYELAKAHGYDDTANYPNFMVGDWRTAGTYPNQKIWLLEERSRTDTDGGKEIMGKVVNTYIIDAVTGEFLEKHGGRL